VVRDVIALVFLSAFALDEAESCASVQEPFPRSLFASTFCLSAGSPSADVSDLVRVSELRLLGPPRVIRSGCTRVT